MRTHVLALAAHNRKIDRSQTGCWLIDACSDLSAGPCSVWGNVHKDAIVHRDRIYRNYELDFSAPAYPLFPTGCLHALTYEVVHWITCIRPELRRFKSADDTTLGVFKQSYRRELLLRRKHFTGCFSLMVWHSIGIWLSVAPHKVRMSKSMYPVRGEGCKPSALLFRREDPPVTFETIARAYSLWPISIQFPTCYSSRRLLG